MTERINDNDHVTVSLFYNEHNAYMHACDIIKESYLEQLSEKHAVKFNDLVLSGCSVSALELYQTEYYGDCAVNVEWTHVVDSE